MKKNDKIHVYKEITPGHQSYTTPSLADDEGMKIKWGLREERTRVPMVSTNWRTFKDNFFSFLRTK